ncbi:MAG: hypothetical protein JWR84_3088 [Caulobacter sp.]|nr:hypothetical protein [Caulobacter sp.]
MGQAARAGVVDAEFDKRSQLSVDLLLFFTAVAEELSFTKAARRLGIDQSWLSHKIRQLETELSCTLFARTTRRIELTSAGESLLESSRRLARATADARRAAWAVSAGGQDELRVGALPYSFYNPERVKILDRFIAEHSETVVDVSNGPSLQLLDRVRLGELDLAFVSWPFEAAGIEVLSIRLDEFCMLVPRGHPLEDLPEVRMSDLAGHVLVMPNARLNPWTFKSLYQPFIDAGVVPAMAPEFQRDSMDRLARSQRWLSLCNLMDVSQRCGDVFLPKPFAGVTITNRKCLVRRKGYTTPAITALWETALELGGQPIEQCEDVGFVMEV